MHERPSQDAVGSRRRCDGVGFLGLVAVADAWLRFEFLVARDSNASVFHHDLPKLGSACDRFGPSCFTICLDRGTRDRLRDGLPVVAAFRLLSTVVAVTSGTPSTPNRRDSQVTSSNKPALANPSGRLQFGC